MYICPTLILRFSYEDSDLECNEWMGRPEQIDLFRSLQPDLAILPELKEKNIHALRPNDAVWITNNHENKSPKGLGLLSFNQTSLSPLSRDEDMEIYIPVSVHNPSYKFDLLGVWNFYFECKQGALRALEIKTVWSGRQLESIPLS